MKTKKATDKKFDEKSSFKKRMKIEEFMELSKDEEGHSCFERLTKPVQK
jgi:hypothetical protein